MGRIDSVFARKPTAAFIPYITVGYPTVEASLEAVGLLEASGADLIELGIPFSDPLADGVTIQQASFQALANGVTPELCLEIVARLRKKTSIPLVFMSYFNPLFSYGVEAFCKEASRAGADGLIVPDLPPEEADELGKAALRYGLDLIFLLAPTSTEARIRLVAGRSSGFIYLVTVTGVTGPRDLLPPDLPDFIARVRRYTSLPLCVGFGVSTPEQARTLARLADGIIVGSRLVEIMGSGEKWQERLTTFAREFAEAVAQEGPAAG